MFDYVAMTTRTFDLVAKAADDIFDLVVREQIGNLARRQQVVDEHKEFLVCDLWNFD